MYSVYKVKADYQTSKHSLDSAETPIAPPPPDLFVHPWLAGSFVDIFGIDNMTDMRGRQWNRTQLDFDTSEWWTVTKYYHLVPRIDPADLYIP